MVAEEDSKVSLVYDQDRRNSSFHVDAKKGGTPLQTERRATKWTSRPAAATSIFGHKGAA